MRYRVGVEHDDIVEVSCHLCQALDHLIDNLDDANQTIARRRRFDEDIEQAKTAAREASLVAKRAQQALAQSVYREPFLPPPRHTGGTRQGFDG